MANLLESLPPEEQILVQNAERRRKLADALRNKSAMPQGQMVGDRYVAPSITQYLASGLNGIQANRIDRESDQQQQDIYRQRGETIKSANQRLAEALKPKQVQDGFEQITPERQMDSFGSPNPNQDMTPQQGNPVYKTVQPTPDDQYAALAQFYEATNNNEGLANLVAQRAQTGAQQQNEEKLYNRGRKDKLSDIDAERKYQDIVRNANQGFQISQQDRQFAQQFELQGQNQRFQAGENSKNRALTRETHTSAGGYSTKPLPTTALKLQNESLDKLSIANNNNTRLKRIQDQIEGGKLELGLISNINANLRNRAGVSTESSRNLSSFKSTMEKLRNDSLRLNTGVQTDGDAQRAWNELFENINDEDLVLQRLREIQEINTRGAELQKLQVENIRSNYNAPAVDFSRYEAKPSDSNETPSANPAVDALLEKYK